MDNNAYLKLVEESRKAKIKLTKDMESRTRISYRKVSKELKEKVMYMKPSTAERFLEGQIQILSKEIDSITKRLGDATKADMARVAKSATNPTLAVYQQLSKDYNLGMGKTFKDMFSRSNKYVIDEILSGNIYKDNLGLDERLWINTKSAKENVQRTVIEGISAKKDYKERAKDLIGLVNPDDKTAKQIHYTAERLARTSIQHAYQMAIARSTKDNPFTPAIEWRSVLQDRTCELCRTRNGVQFHPDDLPLDHPNGLCTMLPTFIMTYNEMGDYLNDWIHGGNDDGAVERWLKTNQITDNEIRAIKKRGPSKPRPAIDNTFRDKAREAIKKITPQNPRERPSIEDFKSVGEILVEELLKGMQPNTFAIEQYEMASVRVTELKRAREILEDKYKYFKKYPSGEWKDTGISYMDIAEMAYDRLYDVRITLATEEYKAYTMKGAMSGPIDASLKNFRDVLSKVRPMGLGNNDVSLHMIGTKKNQKLAKKAFNNYPTDWYLKSFMEGPITLKHANRGYYNEQLSEIALNRSKTEDERLNTLIHELGHRMESVVPGLRGAEADFYNYRTKGEDLEWMGKPYSKNEVTRKDDFLNPYMGKDYGGQAYELVSMGFQYIQINPVLMLKDREMAEWILGLMAYL